MSVKQSDVMVAMQEFLKNKDVDKYLQVLENNKGCEKEEFHYGILGCHYIELSDPDESMALRYFKISLNIRFNAKTAYNIGCIYQDKIEKKHNENDEKEMISHYLQAINHGHMQAAHNLGSYYVNSNHEIICIPGTNLQVESLLLQSYKAGIQESLDGLIVLYEKRKDHESYIKCLKHRFANSRYRDTNTFHLILLSMLDNHKYMEMCLYFAALGFSHNEMTECLRVVEHENTKIDECSICKKDQMGFILKCLHLVCITCTLVQSTNDEIILRDNCHICA